MVKYKSSKTKGVSEDKIIYEQIAQELEIPPSIMDKGISAIINWINESKSGLGIIAAGALIYSYFNKNIELLNTSIYEKAKIKIRTNFLFFPGTKSYRGRVVNEKISINELNNDTEIEIPTSTILNIYKVNKQISLISFLDKTELQAKILTENVIVKSETFFETEILNLRTDRLISLEGDIKFPSRNNNKKDVERLTT